MNFKLLPENLLIDGLTRLDWWIYKTWLLIPLSGISPRTRVGIFSKNNFENRISTSLEIGFGSIRLMEDNKQLGTLGFNPNQDRDKTNFWGSEIKTNRVDTSLKIGYVFPRSTSDNFP